MVRVIIAGSVDARTSRLVRELIQLEGLPLAQALDVCMLEWCWRELANGDVRNRTTTAEWQQLASKVEAAIHDVIGDRREAKRSRNRSRASTIPTDTIQGQSARRNGPEVVAFPARIPTAPPSGINP